MNRTFYAICLMLLGCFSLSCEKQSYKETRQFTHHGEHGHGEPGGHTDKSHGAAEHTDPAHGDKEKH
jgi:hypothetical protein